MAPKVFGSIEPEAFGGFSPGKFNDLPKKLVERIDGEQLGELPPKTLVKMDDDLISYLRPKSFGGITEKQAKRLKPYVVQQLNKKQVAQFDIEALDSLPAASLDAIYHLLTPRQMAGLEVLGMPGLGASPSPLDLNPKIEGID